MRKEKQYHFIYKTTNTLSGRYYIGMHSTDNLEDGYLGSGIYLRRSLNKHGKENHKLEILEFCKTRNELKSREQKIVNLNEIAKNDCMNLKVGGEGGFVSKEASELGGKRSSIIFRKRMDTDVEFRKLMLSKISEGVKRGHKNGTIPGIHTLYDWTDKHHSDETKKKMSESSKGMGKGKLNSQFGTRWITNGTINKKIKNEDKIPNGFEIGRILKK